MKPRKVYLDELTSTSKNYKVKVTVIEKRRPKTSPEKLQYQSLVMQDEKGNTMRGALFGDQVGIYEEAIKRNRKYEISSASVSPLKPEYRTTDSDVNYQMTFTNRTIIMPVDTDECSDDINYCPISQLPRASDYSEMFDIVGIVLFVEDQPRKIVTVKHRESVVREIVLIDHSTSQPLTISVWDELAEDDCTMLIPTPGKFRTVGLTALRVSPHRGFSMTTSASTVFVHSPVGERADALTAWMTSHTVSLTQLQSRLLSVKMPVPVEQTNKISVLRVKKAKMTLQDETHWLEVTIPNADFQKINAYMGCSNCWRRSNVPPGKTYTCDSCSKTDCTSVPKVTFNCDISDGTGLLPMTAFTTIAESLFRMSAADIFHMKHTEDEQSFSAVQELLRTTPFRAQVGPAKALSINNVLQWVVKRVVVDGEDSDSWKTKTSKLVAEQALNVDSSEECSTVPDNYVVQPIIPESIAPNNQTLTELTTGVNIPANLIGNADSAGNKTIKDKKKAKKEKTNSPSAPV